MWEITSFLFSIFIDFKAVTPVLILGLWVCSGTQEMICMAWQQKYWICHITVRYLPHFQWLFSYHVVQMLCFISVGSSWIMFIHSKFSWSNWLFSLVVHQKNVIFWAVFLINRHSISIFVAFIIVNFNIFTNSLLICIDIC